MPNPFLALIKLWLEVRRQCLSFMRSLFESSLGAPPMPSQLRSLVPVTVSKPRHHR